MQGSPKYKNIYSKNISQKNLHSFFYITHRPDAKHKKCFIYDPENKCASFDYSPNNTDLFIVEKMTIKLYYRPPSIIIDKAGPSAPGPISNDSLLVSVPLLKSNLQKAIRRCHNNIAIQSAIQLIHLDKIQFLRRLPIIYIEDVCLMDSFPMVVWLMMADKHYTLTSIDIDILLHCVNGLCECKKVIAKYSGSKAEGIRENSGERVSSEFGCIDEPIMKKYTHEYLENMENHTELLSIYYRSQYGGMDGDMRMLEDAIEYYIANPHSIERTHYGSIDFDQISNMDIEILVEAIDFHPFPHMLSILEKRVRLDKMVIKEYIWNAESGYNIRKPETREKSKKYMANSNWQLICLHLDEVRDLLVSS